MEREQIGKAVLDYRFYTGEDKYTDGDIEDEMLEIAKTCAPEEYDRVITEKRAGRSSIIFLRCGKILSAGFQSKRRTVCWRSAEDREQSQGRCATVLLR